ncbi:MAG TPA: hypothetical protein VFH46_07885 [Pyrinomonadaceae bacterium]|nr:hypothetical protein [Pyrinomonadaceae bacterium]
MTDERITAYLLQELPEGAAEQFEEQCFAQPEWPAGELESAENDLIEAYVRKELSPERQQRFEKYYLTTTAREDRVLLARSFMRVACSADPPKPNWLERLRNLWNARPLILKYASVGMVVLMLGVGLLIWSRMPHSAPKTFANLNLTAVSEDRSQGVSTARQKIKLPLGADALRVSLTLPEPTPKGASYSVQWKNSKGSSKTLEIESQDASSVNVVIPADELVPGRYALKLLRKNQDGTEDRVNGNYFFDVE